VILAEDHTLPFVNVFMNFRASPAFDPPGRAGLGTLAARLLPRGTLRRDRNALEEAIEALGADLVCAAQRDSVSVGGAVLTRHLEAFVGLLTEVITAPALAESEFEKAKRELLAELAADRDDDATLAAVWLRRALYTGHPFAHGTRGTIAGVTATTREDVVAHLPTVLTRPHLIIGASGDVDRATLDRLLAPCLSALPDTERPFEFPPMPRPAGRRVVLVDKPDRSQTQLVIGHAGMTANDPDHLAVEIATMAFGGYFSSRLMDEVRVKRGWSYGAYARLGTERAGASYVLQAAPSTEYAPETAALMLEQFEKMVEPGLTDAEIEFARESMLNAFPFRVETPALRVAQVVQARLLGRPDDSIDTWRDRVRALSPDQIRDAARRRLTPQDCAIVMVCTADDVRAKMEALPGVASVEVVPHDTP
jgi:zinc protease